MRMNYRMGERGDRLDIEIFDDIGYDWWTDSGVTCESVQNQIRGHTGPIRVLINSYGGDVKEGLGIYNALKMHPGPVETVNMGFACSIAAIIFMAGDTRTACEASLLMLHDAWTYAMGNSRELRAEADALDIITEATKAPLVQSGYASKEEVDRMFAEETWLDAKAASSMGFATRIEAAQVPAYAASAKARVSELLLKGTRYEQAVTSMQEEQLKCPTGPIGEAGALGENAKTLDSYMVPGPTGSKGLLLEYIKRNEG